MSKTAHFACGLLVASFSSAGAASAQTATGSLEFVARITPTAARPEPVRQFTFYILTKSYTANVKEVEEKDPPPARDAFIDSLTVSPELRAWLKGHDTLDLTSPELDKLLTSLELIGVSGLPGADERSNRVGVTCVPPRVTDRAADRTARP